MNKLQYWEQRIEQSQKKMQKIKKKSRYFQYVRYQFKSMSVFFLKEGDQIAIQQQCFHGLNLYAVGTIKQLLQSHYDDMQFGFIIEYFNVEKKIYFDANREVLVLEGKENE